MSRQIQPVILSGGSGSRLWPLSRSMYPKQLLALVTENTMLQETALRLNNLNIDKQNVDGGNIQILPPIIVCNEEHRFFVAEQMRQMNIQNPQIILEPTGRNTAPALTLAALATQEKSSDAVMLVMPADHVINDIETFHQIVKQGLMLAMDNYLVTFGIEPNTPETGYGYIKVGSSIKDSACLIDSFVEKPDAITAQGYLDSGDYLWNSGLFMMTAASWLHEIKSLNTDIFTASTKSYENAVVDNDFYRIDKEAFEASPSDSIDYAVMEKAAGKNTTTKHKAAVIPLDAGWSDVGVWSTLWEVGEKDKKGNVTKGDVSLHDTENSLLYSSERYIAAVGLKDTIVVETTDAILVANKNNAQDVKKVVEALKEKNRDEYQNHRLVFRPWGSYECIDRGKRYQVKRITVNPGAALSLQLHHHRAEHWIVVSGTAQVTRGDEVFLVSENESTYIPLGTKHRLENKGSIPLEMIEVQSGSYLGEDDIVRFEDIYGRSGSK